MFLLVMMEESWTIMALMYVLATLAEACKG
jgi:hypothetical protein